MDARQDPAVSRALQSSDTEGVLSQISSHIVEFYLQPCALFVGATAAQVGWLAGCTRLLNALAQYASPAAVRAGRGRRSLLIAGAVLQGAALVPIALVTLHPGRGALIVVFGGALAFQALGGFMYPAWASLMSEYLPESRRASYFGRRGRLLAAWGLATLVLWGFALDGAGPLRSGAAFALVFGAGALCRLVSTRWMADLKPLPDHEPPILPASPWRQRLRGPLGRLTLYAAVASASTQLCDALLAAHMLGDLHFGYRRYMLVRLAWCVGQTATASAWGRLADSRGPARLLRVAGFSLVLAPLVWALTDRLWLVAAFELLDGAAAAGFSLCAANHLYDAVPAESRLRAVGLYNLWCGVAIFAGAGLGASLAARGAPLHALFGAAAALRLLAELVLGRRVREVRTGAPKTSRLDLLFGLGLGFERLFAPALAARQPE